MTEGVLSRISRVASSSLPNAALVNDADRISVGDLREVMRLLADRAPHWEVETYTWGVLPPARRDALAADGLTGGVVDELRALVGVLADAADDAAATPAEGGA